MSHVRRFDHVGLTVADLDVVTAFFVALGLEVEGRTFVEGEFLDTVCGIPDSRTEIGDGRMAGAAWHLELVHDPDDVTPAAPAEEDLLVLYLGGEVDEDVIGRLVGAGGTRVAARNPYWDQCGVTIADPDGYRLVLSARSWP
jgi:catechol 2,3-dioxygenase-like lactoylglutathione lyase family enzyme